LINYDTLTCQNLLFRQVFLFAQSCFAFPQACILQKHACAGIRNSAYVKNTFAQASAKLYLAETRLRWHPQACIWQKHVCASSSKVAYGKNTFAQAGTKLRGAPHILFKKKASLYLSDPLLF